MSAPQCRVFSMDRSCSDVCLTCRRPEVEHTWLIARRVKSWMQSHSQSRRRSTLPVRRHSRVIGRREARLQQTIQESLKTQNMPLKLPGRVRLTRINSHRRPPPKLIPRPPRYPNFHPHRYSHHHPCCPNATEFTSDCTFTESSSSSSSPSSLTSCCSTSSSSSTEHEFTSTKRVSNLINSQQVKECKCGCSTDSTDSDDRQGKGQRNEKNSGRQESRIKRINEPLTTQLPKPKMGLLKTASSTASSTSPKRNITFDENGPEVIYREAFDSEDEEEFFELSLKSESAAAADSAERSPTLDFDENDPERIKLRQLTESNTLFNSNYANFKLNDPGTGLGRSKPATDSGPIKFVIQDGYKQPLPPTKYKPAANSNIKNLFENNNCDTNKIPISKPTKPTNAPPPKPTNAPLTKPVLELKKPPEKLVKTSPEKANSNGISSIPTIRIPRASIQFDKLNRSPPPVSHSQNPLEKLSAKLPEKPVITAKPEKPPKTVGKLTEKKKDIPVKTEHRNSVILLDETDGTILPLDSQKLPAELKNEDVVDQEQLYMITKKEQESREKADDCLSDSGSDSGASGCSPNSASPTQQLEDRTPSASPSPDSLDSSPDSYDLMKSEGDSDMSSRPSPVPPPSGPPPPPPRVSSELSEVTKVNEVKEKVSEKSNLINTPIILPKVTLSSSTLLPSESAKLEPKPEAPTDSGDFPVEFKSIKSRDPENLDPIKAVPQPQPQVNSNASQDSTGLPVVPPNPNNKTMISISYRRSSSQLSAEANDGVKRNQMLQKLAMDLEQHRSGSSSNLSENGSIESSSGSSAGSNNRPTIQEPPTPLSPMDQFIADCCDDDDELTNSKSKKHFTASTDSETDSDSECDPLPDMIKSDEEANDSEDSDLSDAGSNFHRRSSKESASKSSTSSIGSKSKEKSVSAMFKNVVNNTNTKKYTKLMKKNISKTSKFIVNTTKQIGSETTDMVKKFKDKTDKSKTGDNFYYGEEYSETKQKSKWTFSPNTNDDHHEDGYKKKKKFEVYSTGLRNGFNNIKGKIQGSKGAGPVGHAEMPIDPFGRSTQAESEGGPALLKIKRLDSMIEPNYSEPNLLLNSTQKQGHGTQSESNLHKPPLPPRNHRIAPGVPEPEAELAQTKPTPPPLPENPPQAPVRRKKLAKKRDQIILSDSKDSSIEMSFEPQQHEMAVSEAQPSESQILSPMSQTPTEMTLSQLRADYEAYFKVFDQNQDSIDIFQNQAVDSKLYRVFRCKSGFEEFYLLSSKIIWTTCYDSEIPTNFTFQNEPCRYISAQFSKFFDVTTFCKKILNSAESSSLTTESRGQLVDSLVLQLYTILAQFEQNSKTGVRSNRTIGDVNESLVGVHEDSTGSILDVLLLLPTKELDSDDEGDSLSMMQSFCLQVFLIRLTSMITNEDNEVGGGGVKRSGRHAHYRNLVRRNKNGFSSLRDLYLLCSVDIFTILTGPKKSLTNEVVEQQVAAWFQEQATKENVAQNYSENLKFIPGNVLSYGRIIFAIEADNQLAAVELATKELTERI